MLSALGICCNCMLWGWRGMEGQCQGRLCLSLASLSPHLLLLWTLLMSAPAAELLLHYQCHWQHVVSGDKGVTRFLRGFQHWYPKYKDELMLAAIIMRFCKTIIQCVRSRDCISTQPFLKTIPFLSMLTFVLGLDTLDKDHWLQTEKVINGLLVTVLFPWSQAGSAAQKQSGLRDRKRLSCFMIPFDFKIF